jgi:ubiquinone/menaquinone biosynthesis C-methylase UbiE
VIGTYAFEALRHEYDPEVLDSAQRTQRAQRLYAALCAADLWRPQARLLDVGCGSGLLLAALGRDTRQRVGCDVRRSLYVHTREQVGGVLFTQADAMYLPFPDGAFDLVTCLAAIEECMDWRGALQEMARCVAPGGVLYVTVTNGRLLTPWYTWVERLGVHVRASAWAYSVSSLRLTDAQPEAGFSVPALATWRYIHLTPYLARRQWPWLRLLPFPFLGWCMRHFAPSMGFAWQRPLQDAEMEYVATST